MTKPVRLQLSRKRGFSLQAWSREVNGLPAVNVARPSRFGSPYRLLNEDGFPLILDQRGRVPEGCLDLTWPRARVKIVDLFRRAVETSYVDRCALIGALRGRNVACFCGLDVPCHGDVWLEMSNADPAGLAMFHPEPESGERERT